MPRDKTATHIKIMAAAQDEFLEFGYEKASMRSIADRCSMTAAGVYRHCRDKEDLFDQLVSPWIERLKEWQGGHVGRYQKAFNEESVSWQDSWVDMMREVVYPHMEEYHLLFAKAGGSRYGNYLHDMIEQSQERFWSYLPQIRAKGYPVWDIQLREFHLLLTAYMTALFEPVIHNYPQEEAAASLEVVEAFFLPGWKKLMGF